MIFVELPLEEMNMSEDDTTIDLEFGEAEPEPKPEPEKPYLCGHYVSIYEHEGSDYCGICGALVA